MLLNVIPLLSDWLNEDYWDVSKKGRYVMYHATLEKNVDSIMKEGIRPSKKSGRQFSEPLVWMADNVDAARTHAASRAKFRHEEGKVVVLKLSIDPKKVKLNRSFTKGVYNVEGSVPPEMIDSVTESLNESDSIPGGLADGMSLEEIAKKHGVGVDELKMQHEAGKKVESEHTSDPKIAAEIAKDHLFEDPKYYVKLRKVEESADDFDHYFEFQTSQLVERGKNAWTQGNESHPGGRVHFTQDPREVDHPRSACADANRVEAAIRKLLDSGAKEPMATLSWKNIEVQVSLEGDSFEWATYVY